MNESNQRRRTDGTTFYFFANYHIIFIWTKTVSSVSFLSLRYLVANDEPTNGVKILRRRDPPVDLHTDLPTLSNMSVVQRLKLILEKLESGQLDQVPPEVLQKNIQYAIQLIQDGDPLLNKDRFERKLYTKLNLLLKHNRLITKKNIPDVIKIPRGSNKKRDHAYLWSLSLQK